MATEQVPASTQSDGKWRITTVPTGSNAKSVAILNGGTAKPITYGLTADGWQHAKTQAKAEDKRLTYPTDLSRPGRVTETLTVTAVASVTADSADVLLSALAVSGAEIQFLVRRAVDNSTTHTIGQIGDIVTGVIGVRRPNPPTENGVDTVSFDVHLTLATQDQIVLIA